MDRQQQDDDDAGPQKSLFTEIREYLSTKFKKGEVKSNKELIKLSVLIDVLDNSVKKGGFIKSSTMGAVDVWLFNLKHKNFSDENKKYLKFLRKKFYLTKLVLKERKY